MVYQKKNKRQRPAFPGGLPPSIISAKELNFCVRYGNRCDLPAIVTAYFVVLKVLRAPAKLLAALSKLNKTASALLPFKPVLVKFSTY